MKEQTESERIEERIEMAKALGTTPDKIFTYDDDLRHILNALAQCTYLEKLESFELKWTKANKLEVFKEEKSSLFR